MNEVNQITDAALFDNIIGAARNAREAALVNVSAILLYGLQRAWLKSKKDVYKRNAVDRCFDADLARPTAYRHVKFAFDALTVMEKKLTNDENIAAIRNATDCGEAAQLCNAYLASVGCSTAEDIALWAKGGGIPLTHEARHSIRKGEDERRAAGKAERAIAKGKAAEEALQAANDDCRDAAADAAREAAGALPDATVAEPVTIVLEDFLPTMSDDELATLMRAVNAEMKRRAEATAEAIAA